MQTQHSTTKDAWVRLAGGMYDLIRAGGNAPEKLATIRKVNSYRGMLWWWSTHRPSGMPSDGYADTLSLAKGAVKQAQLGLR